MNYASSKVYLKVIWVFSFYFLMLIFTSGYAASISHSLSNSSVCSASNESLYTKYTKVIARLGHTQSIAPYLDAVNKKDEKNTIKNINNQLDSQDENSSKNFKISLSMNSQMNYQMDYTVHTAQLSSGVVQVKSLKMKDIMQPIYIIGDDSLSKQWLDRYARRLKAIHALGFIVNVNSNDAYFSITKKYGIKPLPVNGAAFAKRFGIQHYPVLISQYGIEQ